MPKEVIYGLPVPYYPPEEGGEPQAVPVIVVSWNKESGDIQIVTRERDHEMHSADDDPIPCQYGYYVTPNRTAINDLIRVLRRARDQTFGRDE